MTTPDEMPGTPRGLIMRAMGRRKAMVLPGLWLMTQWQVCEALVPVAIGIIIDYAIIPLDYRALIVSMLGLIVLFTVLSLSYRFGARLFNKALHHESHALRMEVARVPLGPRGAPRGVSAGEVLSLSSADAEVASLVFRQVGLGGSAIIAVIGVSAYLLWTDLLVGLVVVLGVPLSLLLAAAPARVISRRSGVQQAAIAQASRQASDIMHGLRVVKAIGGEPWAQRHYSAASQHAADAGIATAERTGRVQGLGAASMSVVLAAVLVVAGWRVVEGEMAIGQLVSVVGVAVFFEEPVRTITQMVSVFARSHAAAQRIVDYVAGAGDARDGTAVPAGATVRFDGLELGEGRRLDHTVDAGSFTALVADEPAVAARIAEALAGGGSETAAVCIGGRPRNSLAAGIAAHLVVPPHQADLFEGTIRSNIVMSHDGEVPVRQEVLDASAVAELLELFPDGLDHPIREDGRNLSGGQRQRVALARALHADPAVLVLHDPTSAVDAVTELEIARAVRRIRAAPRTTIVITSSPAFLAAADTVVHVPQSGPITSGTHQDLAMHSTIYRTAVDR